jgi:hypothetical protein
MMMMMTTTTTTTTTTTIEEQENVEFMQIILMAGRAAVFAVAV